MFYQRRASIEEDARIAIAFRKTDHLHLLFPCSEVLSLLQRASARRVLGSSGVCAVVIFGSVSRLARCAARRRLGRINCLAENQYLRNQIGLFPLQTVLLRGFVRRFCFAGLAGRAVPAPDRPQARTYAPNYSANLAVSRSYRTNSKASKEEQTVEREPFNRCQQSYVVQNMNTNLPQTIVCTEYDAQYVTESPQVWDALSS